MPDLVDDDRDRIDMEHTDFLRDATVLLDDREVLTYEPDYATGAEDHAFVMARLRGRYRSAHPEKVEQ